MPNYDQYIQWQNGVILGQVECMLKLFGKEGNPLKWLNYQSANLKYRLKTTKLIVHTYSFEGIIFRANFYLRVENAGVKESNKLLRKNSACFDYFCNEAD